MIRWTMIFLNIALIAAVIAYGDLFPAISGISKIVFYVFIVFFFLSLTALPQENKLDR